MLPIFCGTKWPISQTHTAIKMILNIKEHEGNVRAELILAELTGYMRSGNSRQLKSVSDLKMSVILISAPEPSAGYSNVARRVGDS
jgi:hypothetical protein